MSADRILALDVGTQSVRAMVFDPSRRAARAVARSRSSPTSQAQPGCCEQDADLYWRALGEACQRLWAMPDGPARRDRGRRAHDPARHGRRDRRGRRAAAPRDGLARPVPGRGAAAGSAASGGSRSGRRASRETVATFMAEAEANVHRAARSPRRGRASATTCCCPGSSPHRLTGRVRRLGRARRSATCRSTTSAAALGRRRATGSGRPCRSEPDWLPRLVPPGEALGTITAAAAEATGIPPGLPLIAAAGDKACEVLGSGALEPDDRRAVARHDGDDQHDPPALHRGHPGRAAVPGRDPRRVQPRGQGLPRLLDDRVVQARVRGARGRAAPRREGVEPEALFDELIAATPPGSMGLILQPYWSPGVRDPGPEAKGADHRLGRRAHPGPPLPRDPRGSRLRPARGRRAHGQAHQGADPRAARVRRRLAEPGRGPAHRRHLRPADVAPAHPRDLRARARRSTRPSASASTRSFEAAVASMTRIAETREPRPGDPRRCTSSSTAGCT